MNRTADFKPFPKIPRWSRDIIITEKIDGTNACVVIGGPLDPAPEYFTLASNVGVWWIAAASRNGYLLPTGKFDNFGFARWVLEHVYELLALGRGQHFGEWWGYGIQRGYELKEKRFSLFNVQRWSEKHFSDSNELVPNDQLKDKQEFAPECCGVVPTLFQGPITPNCEDNGIDRVMFNLISQGSRAAPGYENPEGIVIYHTASNQLYKKTIEADSKRKGEI